MGYFRRILFYLSFSLLALPVLADVFVVTNTNNSGPGSLRDALESADRNGTGVRDFIQFNIPSNRGPVVIKIPVVQLLPALSANLVIDGTTQPGPALGASSAKVTLSLEGNSSSPDYLTIFEINKMNDVAIYGLVLQHLVIDRATGIPPPQLHAVVIRGGSNIEIGAAGKGNVISGWNHAIRAENNPQTGAVYKLQVKGNILGLGVDGVSTSLGSGGRGGTTIPAANLVGVFVETGLDTEIGGLTPAEGNIINSSLMDIFSAGMWWYSSDNTMTISNNRIGYDIRNNVVDAAAGIGIQVRKFSKRFSLSRTNLGVLISDNQIGSRSRMAGIVMDSIQTFFAIENNIIGGELNGAAPSPAGYNGIGIHLTECDMGVIGGDNFGWSNTIRYWKQGALVCDRTSNIKFRYNSTYCNKDRAIELNQWKLYNPSPYRVQPKVTINYLDIPNRLIGGTATPNSWVDVYVDDECPDCEGKQHLGGMFAVIRVGANGQWSFTDWPNDRGNLVVTTTDDYGTTSEYSAPEIDSSAIQVGAVTCKGVGANICGLKIVSGTQWEWLDSTGTVVGHDTCLSNVSPGKYYFRLSIGPGFCEKTWMFRVLDKTLDIDSSKGISVINTRCGLANGSITGFVPKNALRWQWEDAAGNVVSTSVDLQNSVAGTYRFHVFNATCDVVTAYYEIRNTSPSIDQSATVITDATCNLPNGSIKGIRLNGMAFSSSLWINDQGASFGSFADLNNVPPGNYKMVVLDLSGSCGDSTGWLTIKAVPAPALNTAAAVVTDATCGNANGSINSISWINTQAPLAFRWEDANGNTVAVTAAFANQKAGSYRLKLKDGSTCDTLVSPWFDIKDLGAVQLDTTQVTVKDAGCTKNNGSIIGLKISGATQWQWVNTNNGATVSTNTDMYNLGTGTYRLRAVNTVYGCTQESPVYTVAIAPPLPLSVNTVTVTDATCNNNNGSVNIQSFTNNPALFSFTWLKDSLQPAGSTPQLQDLAPADYHLIATDTNGCVRNVYQAKIRMAPLPILSENNLQIAADTCELHTGSIRGLLGSSDLGTVRYSWKDPNGKEFSTTPSLLGVPAGLYQLTVTDKNNCTLSTEWYRINPVITTLPQPVVDPQTIPRYANTTLKVKQLYPGGVYTLYDPATGTTWQTSNNGVFTLTNVREDLHLEVRVDAGPCKSAAGPVFVKVEDKTQLDVPNAFSPNGDGINELFHIRVIGYFQLQDLKIFNRWGQQVFETRDLGKEWNGSYNGKPLPVGTYYWIIEGLDVKGEKIRQTGSITLIR